MEKQSLGADVTDDTFPTWLSVPNSNTPVTHVSAHEKRQLALAEFETVFPRVMDMVASGYDLTKAVEELPIKIDVGSFNRWIKKDPIRHEQLKDAQELRSEVWADRMMRHAMGEYELEDVNRSKLVVDTYKWRIAADNRRKYGASTHIEVGGTISITGALAAARDRVIAGEVVDVTPKEIE
jgi:hypothetical protein